MCVFFFNEALINADQRLVFQFETEWLTKAEVKRFKRTCTETTVSFLIVITHNPPSNGFFCLFVCFFVFTPVCQTGQILNGAAHHPLPFSPFLPSFSGPAILSQRSSHRRLVRRLGAQVLPAAYSLLHMRAHSADEDQPLVRKTQTIVL